MDTASTPAFMDLIGHGAASLLAFAGALTLSSVAVLNKGARVNLAWALAAAGLVLIGLAEASRLSALIGLPSLSARAADLLVAAGLAVILAGLLYARGLFKRLLK